MHAGCFCLTLTCVIHARFAIVDLASDLALQHVADHERLTVTMRRRHAARFVVDDDGRHDLARHISNGRLERRADVLARTIDVMRVRRMRRRQCDTGCRRRRKSGLNEIHFNSPKDEWFAMAPRSKRHTVMSNTSVNYD